MPRLVFIVTSPLTAFALLRGQMAFLARSGFEVVLITGREPADLVEAVRESEGVEVVTVPLRREIRPLHDLAALVRLLLLLRRLRPDVVNAGTPKAALLGLLAARMAGVPHRVYTLRGLRLETTRGPLRRLLTAAERLTAWSAHRIVCVSESLRRRYHELGLGGGRTTVLASGSSNGIDLERFDAGAPSPGELETLRAALGIDASTPVVGFVGRLTRDKGIADLVEAFGEVTRALPETRLLLLGEVERGDPPAPAIARRLEEDPAIVRAGFVEDPRPHYRLIDLLVLPSYREGFPNAVLEAAAARVPTVGYEATGTVDAIVPGQTGELVPPGRPRELAGAILAYLDDPERRRRHGEAARRRVEREFDSPRLWRAWLAFLRELVGAPGAPATRGQ